MSTIPLCGLLIIQDGKQVGAVIHFYTLYKYSVYDAKTGVCRIYISGVQNADIASEKNAYI